MTTTASGTNQIPSACGSTLSGGGRSRPSGRAAWSKYRYQGRPGGNQYLACQFAAGGNAAFCRAEFHQVVNRAQHRQSARDAQGQEQIAIREIAGQQQAAQKSRDKEQPAHRRRRLLALVQTADLGRVALDRFAEAAGQPGNRARPQDYGQQEAEQGRQRCAAVIFPRPARDEAAATCWIIQSSIVIKAEGGRMKKIHPSAFPVFPEQPGRRIAPPRRSERSPTVKLLPERPTQWPRDPAS